MCVCVYDRMGICQKRKQLVEWGYESWEVGGGKGWWWIFFHNFYYINLCVFVVRYEEFLLILMGMRCTIYVFCIYLCEVSHFLHIFIILLFICVVWMYRHMYDNDYERKKGGSVYSFLCRWSIFCSNIFS